MNEQTNPKQPSKRTRAAMQAGEARRRRMAAVRARETVIENTVIDVIAAKIAITESEDVLMRGVARLKELGENPESITELCQMSLSDVKAALASAKEMAEAVVVPRTRTHEAVARAQGHSDV